MSLNIDLMLHFTWNQFPFHVSQVWLELCMYVQVEKCFLFQVFPHFLLLFLENVLLEFVVVQMLQVPLHQVRIFFEPAAQLSSC